MERTLSTILVRQKSESDVLTRAIPINSLATKTHSLDAESDLDPFGKTKTSKRQLNINAAKFKLKELKQSSIRYEVIYKNLVRDLRKYIAIDFNEVTEYAKRKKNSKDSYINFTKVYIKTKL